MKGCAAWPKPVWIVVACAGAALIGGPTKAFELPLPNLLWMADAMYGPTLKLAEGKSQRTVLFAILDDHSRLCVHGQFYAAERLECFLDCLRQAVSARGLPDKLYTDNGAAFRSQHLQIVCANLGIKLLHARPYHSWSRGKIERFFLTVQTQFQAQLHFQPATSLEELNRAFWRWVETDYHQRPHAALQDQTPAQRFAQAGVTLRTLAPDADLQRLFLMRVSRRVRKDATISLGAQAWEVPVHLHGVVIQVHFDPVHWSRVEVWLAGALDRQGREGTRRRHGFRPGLAAPAGSRAIQGTVSRAAATSARVTWRRWAEAAASRLRWSRALRVRGAQGRPRANALVGAGPLERPGRRNPRR